MLKLLRNTLSPCINCVKLITAHFKTRKENNMRSGFDLGAGWNLRLEKWHEDPKISLFRGNTFIKVYRELGKRRDDANDAFWKRKNWRNNTIPPEVESIGGKYLNALAHFFGKEISALEVDEMAQNTRKAIEEKNRPEKERLEKEKAEKEMAEYLAQKAERKKVVADIKANWTLLAKSPSIEWEGKQLYNYLYFDGNHTLAKVNDINDDHYYCFTVSSCGQNLLEWLQAEPTEDFYKHLPKIFSTNKDRYHVSNNNEAVTLINQLLAEYKERADDDEDYRLSPTSRARYGG